MSLQSPDVHFPSLSVGGFIFFDDFFYWPGSRKAAEEFLAARGISITIHRVGRAGWMQKEVR
jgi:hypothetical protein